MGYGRWHYNNFITQTTMLTPSSAKAGILGFAVKQGTGSARMEAYGQYTGDDDEKYTVEVYTTAAGAEVGRALYRWKKASTVSGWEADGLTTQTTYQTLENGIQIRWVEGSGDDFVIGDQWTFFATRPRGRGALLKDDPNTELRSDDALILSIEADLGTTQNVTSVILGYHNWSSAATITLEANNTTAWATPAFSQALTWAERHIGVFINESYRYWRIVIKDQASSESYLALGKWYLGSYFEPDFNFGVGYNRITQVAGGDRIVGGLTLGRWVTGRGEVLTVPYEVMTTTDLATLREVFHTANDRTNHKGEPIWFTPDSDNPSDVLYGLPGMTLTRRFYNVVGQEHRVDIKFIELARTQT